jgi:hypothetical protein
VVNVSSFSVGAWGERPTRERHGASIQSSVGTAHRGQLALR